MDVVEEDKLKWSQPVALPAQVPHTFDARFDFSGRLLPYDADLPATSALYHHGDEPQRAGYTIAELLTLSILYFKSQIS